MLRRAVLLSALALTLAACGQSKPAGEGPLKVGATAVPHAEILEQVKPILADEGIDLQIVVFNDYVQPNTQLAEGRLDANYFQTKPYLDEFNKARGASLVTVAGVHVEPLGAYSRRYKSLAELPAGSDVALPNDASNTGRSLLLLQKAGLITLRKGQDPLQTVADISGNPKGLKFRELEAATLPRVLDQVALAVINTNYALDAQLSPRNDALALEDGDSPYVNYLVTRPDNRDDPRIKALAAALTSQQIKDYINRTYEGAVVPAK
ncbi:MetQ/NlpA family ABC transporter substrate-binding protein [Brevundimonas nasdae]|jgi:D-methionine transport system substrate-binding protein|uniref:MetQ/NlpA family ABC transporter substrate-binding protein n=1 Tax=Brevundimonas nasdae TaxID=172043 RepID=A0ABX8TKR1_9CAUL|nr:MetQ/NlpA family ABC transporter substrate-binding protein [Brevundimonas nasdae]QYC11826.1 MetQ/NlpA family ABC transporter substrate-binding protein [Brevundimonas nasdae]QYC14612.1 MetQ/NlpA family ABC transporter substrate-binding protein [Brevundimonas nasdae]